MSTLRETATLCCKKVYIGAAILPKPLFVLDYDDLDDTESTLDDSRRTGLKITRAKINCATISTVEPDDPISQTTLTRYAQTLTSEFNSVVIEHHLKWAPLCHTMPGPIHQSAPPSDRLGKYDFHHVDAMVDFALEHDMHVKGHVLIWHITSPPCLEHMTGDQVRECVKRHIFTTMAHFKGRIQMWDVVNEALARDGTMAENVFYKKMGPNYIEECFRMAHQADPDAFLIYNDNNVEGCGHGCDDESGIPTVSSNEVEKSVAAPNQAKADGFYNLLRDLVRKGVPIHGAGMQAHFNAGGVLHRRPPTPAMVKRQISRIGKLGLKVNISEMDVRVSNPHLTSSYTRELRSNAQTQIYRDILSAALSEPSFIGIWLWGFTDRHTWVTNFYNDDSPLIFDENYRKKPSYFGFRKALRTLCPGGRVGELTGGEESMCYLKEEFDCHGEPWGKEWMQPEPVVGNHDQERVKDPSKEIQPDWLQP